MREIYSDSATRVVLKAGAAAEPSGLVTTAHLLLALSEAGGFPRGLCGTGQEQPSFRALAGCAPDHHGDLNAVSMQFSCYTAQALTSSERWAASRGEQVKPQHLLVVLLDQRSTIVLDLLQRASIQPQLLREAALAALTLSPDQSLVPLALLPPRGTSDRPPLPVDVLPPTAWYELSLRQAQLPVVLGQRAWTRRAVSANEQRAVMQLADRLGLDDDHRYSLLHHHNESVTSILASGAPFHGPIRVVPLDRGDEILYAPAGGPRVRKHQIWERAVSWCENRWVNFQAARLRRATPHSIRDMSTEA